MKTVAYSLLAVALLFIRSEQVHADLITNGGFENISSIQPPFGWTIVGGGSNTGTDQDALQGDGGSAHSGSHWMAFGWPFSSPTVGIKQSVTATAGVPLDLTFWVANNLTTMGSAGNEFKVTWSAGTANELVLLDTVNQSIGSGYTFESFTIPGAKVTGTPENDVIQFTGFQGQGGAAGNGGSQPFWDLDDVTLNAAAVPEPSSLILCGAVAFGGAFGRWRKCRR